LTDSKLFEEYIPTDKWSLTDWYLSKVVYIDRLYLRICNASLSGSDDRRAMIAFVSVVRAYHISARHNFRRHLGDDYVSFRDCIPDSPKKLNYDVCDRLMSFVSDFHWNSGLTKLSETRAMGSFAKARSNVGLSPKEDDSRG